VTSRGDGREPIVLADADRQLLLDVLGAVVESFGWLCHAYCLMTNHYHVLVETPEANLSRGMRQLNGVYTQRFNRRYRRTGHVFQGRFHAVLVERESHLVELARYVVLNPVRAGMVAAAEDYRWSSLRATLGLSSPPRWLGVSALLSAFGSRARYLTFVREGVGEAPPWDRLRGSLLGSDAFVERLSPRLEGASAQCEVPRRERFAHRDGLDAIFTPQVVASRAARNERIREATRARVYSAAEIGRHLGLHYSTVAKIAAGRRTPRFKT
jgi:REP element-mobilizing transposase RayT